MSDNPLADVAAPDSLDAHVAARTAAWLSLAAGTASPDTQLFARLIAARDARNELALLGLPQPAWRALLARHFTRASAPALPLPVHAIDQIDFVRTLHTVLLAHANASVDPADADCLATIIARACLRPDHLWRDLGLRGRDEVTWMLTRYFPTLVERNIANLRWKKFLAQQRALSLGLTPGPAPGCPGCEDYGHCFPKLA
ncbi:nitrogen fixation protein NifQ [Paraburkholderia bryophila]|uniref:Nitrogen fixation protein NifQ n=1 Tax=Paraburkholderia bryophila TaxID=420952 RepID=A0A329BR28_9BURK|nr:nitrogen fixation protein NifQ [Paraburkholderia bryophila]RAS21385.1 nitrogen fixation protein NifQ [Paraburkholderia bryophila]